MFVTTPPFTASTLATFIRAGTDLPRASVGLTLASALEVVRRAPPVRRFGSPNSAKDLVRLLEDVVGVPWDLAVNRLHLLIHCVVARVRLKD